MADNPLIQRYRYSTLRPRQFWVYVTIYISIVLLIIFLNYSAYKYQSAYRHITSFYTSLYYQFLTFQVIILFIWSAYNSGSAIKEEILNKSFDFFRMLPLPARKKTFGILIGKNLVVLLFASINTLLLVYFGLAGEISTNLQAQIILALISITILTNLTSLLSSIKPAKKKKTSAIVLILLTIFFVIPMAINAITTLATIDNLESYSVDFFKMKIPLLVFISLIALYLSCWILKGILRRFTYEQQPLFTRIGALLFLLGYILIVLGLYYTYIPTMNPQLTYIYWVITLIPVLFIPWGALRNLDDYLEHSRLIRSLPNSKKAGIIPLLSYSNLSLAIALFIVWAVSSTAVTYFAERADMQLLPTLYNILCLFSCYLFFVLLLELYVLYMPISKKIGLLLGFIAILYLALPPILSAIFESGIIYLYSPAGFVVSLFIGSDITNNTIKTSFLLMNALFCVPPAWLIWKRYSYILTQRQRM